METAQLPLCLSLNPLLLPSPPLILKPLIHFSQITSSIVGPTLLPTRSPWFFSEEEHKQDRHTNEVRERGGEGKDESLDAGDQSAVAGKRTGSQGLCCSNINSDGLYRTNIMHEYTFCMLKGSGAAMASVCAARRTHAHMIS